ncbi:AIM24 family protein [soil metagenome]
MTGTGPGSWQPDPEGRYEYRWWDGQSWTDQVSHQGQMGRAALGGAPVVESPVAVQVPQASAPEPYVPQQRAPQQATAMGDGFAGISGDLVDGRFSEKEAKPIANQNSKMLRVRLGEPFMARQGAMVAYQGNVDFAYEGGGASKFIKKALTGEGLPLMRCSGRGDVFLAERAHDVHMLQLSNAGLSISGKNVLAFSASLDWNIERVKGGSIATGGLFNTTLRGTGWVALTTDGPPVVLNAAEAPTFADTNAVVAWSANLQTQLKTSFKAGALVGRGSGEALQVSFHGQGFVIVAPSEGIALAAAHQ